MIKNESEIWKSLPGFPVVEVSTLGRVRTLDRVVPCRGNRTRFLKGHVLKQCDDKNGYLQTRIKDDGNAADTIKQKLQDIGGTGLKIYN